MPDYIQELRFCYAPRYRRDFLSGVLGKCWKLRYPGLFDDEDLRLLRSPWQRRYHFFEWLAAVLLYEACGYSSLVEKYGCANHQRKPDVMRRHCSSALLQLICEDETSGAPDLFVYRDGRPRDFFFCEVKGTRDHLRAHQVQYFRQLYLLTGKPVRVLTLEPV